jgi:lysophospholipase L1-like esterase
LNVKARRLVLAAVAIAILAAWWWVPRADRTAPTSGTRVIAFGDSLVEGVGASRGHDLVWLLSTRVGTPVVNAGRRGDTTAAALARLDRDVLSRDPRVVIVILGGNDLIRRVPREQTLQNMSQIVERIRARGAGVILAPVSLGVIVDQYADGYDEIADRTSSVLVTDILEGILGQTGMTSDPIHPNDRGYELMAARLEPALRAMLR